MTTGKTIALTRWIFVGKVMFLLFNMLSRLVITFLPSSNLRYADDTTLMAESEEELKSLLMKVKEESGKVGLKLNIQNTKIMASGPITSWQIDGDTVADFIFGGSKITADCDCSHEIKRHLLLGRKIVANLESIFKSIDSSALRFLHSPTLTSIHDYWKNHSLD